MGKHIHIISNIDEENKRADCAECGRVSIKRRRSGWGCRVAWNQYNNNSSLGYGYRTGECVLCGKYTKKLVQDHNHENGELRGWICGKCNFTIGLIERGAGVGKIFKYLST